MPKKYTLITCGHSIKTASLTRRALSYNDKCPVCAAHFSKFENDYFFDGFPTEYIEQYIVKYRMSNEARIRKRLLLENPFIDYQAIKERMDPLKKELMEYCYHPSRINLGDE